MKHQVERKAERQADEFLTALSDEFRNSLGSLRNAVQILKRVGSSDERIVSVQAVLDRQVSQLARLLEDLLDLSRLSRGGLQLRQQTTQIGEITRRAAALAQPQLEARGLTLRLEASSDNAWLNADAERLTQVLANLIEEAARRARPRVAVWFRSRLQGDAALFSIGAPSRPEGPDVVALGRGGSLRLQLAQRMIELHRGHLESHRRSDDGEVEFLVQLPARRQAALAATASAEAQVPVPGNGVRPLKVLVIDDNVDAAESLALILSLGGHSVRTAHDGDEGIALARAEALDVVFIDIGLPGIDGFEVARQLRRLPAMRDALLVAVTGFDYDEFPARSRAAGIDRHLVKPVEPAVLEQLLARHAAH